MTEQVILNKSILTDIGNAIRQKEGSTDPIPSIDMANRITNLPSGGEPFFFRPHPSVTPYVDEDGYFVKPDDWDDIESIELPLDKDNMYYLYKVKDMENSWCSFTVTIPKGGTYVTEFGRVQNGEFVSFGSQYNLKQSTFCNLKATFPDEDYVVVHIYITNDYHFSNFSGFKTQAINGITLTANAQPCLMRYGCLPAAITATLVGNRYIVSDHMVGCKGLNSCASFYAACYNLVRTVREDWDTSNVTTFNAMFSNTWSLRHTGDLTGLVQAAATDITSMFSYMYSIQDLDVSGWDTSNVTTIYYTFTQCINLKHLKGVETWDLRNCSYVASTFNACYALEGELDLRNCHLGENVTEWNAKNTWASLFANDYMLEKVDISTWKADDCASIASMFSNCFKLKEAHLPENIGAHLGPTTCASIFNYCVSLKETNGSINGARLTTITSMYNFCYLLENPGFRILGELPEITASNAATAVFVQCHKLTSLDTGWLDFSKFTYATTAATTSSYTSFLTTLLNLEDWIPPINIERTLTLTDMYNLSHESLIRVLNNLTVVSSARTITLGVVNRAKLTADEIAIATNKGWTVA